MSSYISGIYLIMPDTQFEVPNIRLVKASVILFIIYLVS